MLTVKISSKNQITLPKPLLKLLGSKSGDYLFLEPKKEKIVIHPLKESITVSLLGAIKIKPGLKGLPFSQVLQATKKIVAQKLK